MIHYVEAAMWGTVRLFGIGTYEWSAKMTPSE